MRDGGGEKETQSHSRFVYGLPEEEGVETVQVIALFFR